jgi:hypothetical protein
VVVPNLSSWSPQGLLRRAGCAAVVVLAVLASGCGSTNTSSQTSVDTGPGSSTAPVRDDTATTNGNDNPTTSSTNNEDGPSETTSTRRPTTTTTVPVTTTLYDTDEYFEVTFDFQDYICEDHSLWGEQYDCIRYFGGRAPLIFTPDLYCSGPEFNLSCSFTWYPDELDGYEFVTVGFREYVCEDTWAGGWDDKDCYLYNGGDPSSATFGLVDLYCSGSGYSARCDSEWYPNELEDYEFITFGYQDYVCEDAWLGSWGDKDCYVYYGGDPSSVTMGWVDLYCSESGFSMTCDTSEYPSVLEAAAAEWDGYVVLTIGWSDYICDERAFGDMPCVRYYGGSPSSHSFWSPDYYCDKWSYSCEPG